MGLNKRNIFIHVYHKHLLISLFAQLHIPYMKIHVMVAYIRNKWRKENRKQILKF